jgi:DNA-binding response OmpR family regulator
VTGRAAVNSRPDAAARGTDDILARYAPKPKCRKGENHIMLFGKRERAIRRVVIVEDEPLIAFDSEHLLGEAGYVVVATVDTLADVTRLLAEEEFDLILCDIQLRGDGDGMDVARAAAARDVPVLFVSGNCPADSRSLGIGCLAKPYSERTLKSALAAVDRKLRGQPVKRLPPGLSLYNSADADPRVAPRQAE